jgi:HSP20 family molecular chaperone IbpA
MPDLFSSNWLSNIWENWDKALDAPNAVYPYNIKLARGASGEALQYEIEVALAGVSRENIEVKIKDSDLNINIKHSEDKIESSDKIEFLRKGISHRKGQISFALGEKVNKKKIKSSYVDGLLKVIVPLEEPETLDIDIKVT